MKDGPYRDGRVHVAKDRCATCIFRNVKDGRIPLTPGRVAGLVLNARANDAALVCHETYDDPVVCRGYYNLPRPPTPLVLAERLGLLVFDDGGAA